MALYNFLIAEACSLEVVINITRVHEIVPFHLLFANSKQVTESLMWLSFNILVEAVPIKEPELMRIFLLESRICCICETHVGFLEERILLPEAFLSSEGSESRIMSYASAGGDK